MVGAMSEVERAREKESWRRAAFLAAEIINISGKSVKNPIKPDQLIKFNEDEKPKFDPAVRRAEFAETVKRNKEKFWTLVSDESVKRATGE